MGKIKTVRVLSTPPPQWILDAVKKQFDVDWDSDVIFSYDGGIHAIGGIITEDLYVHEKVHEGQQKNFKGGVDAWWKEYLIVPSFRFGEEVKAYQAQMEWVKQNHMNKFLDRLDHCAKSLSGPIYGELISYDEAREIILDK